MFTRYSAADSKAPTATVQEDVVLDIRAYHLGGEIDFPRFCSENNISLPLLQRDHVVIDMQGLASDSVLVGDSSQQQDKGLRAAVVYRFGTVVFFNTDRRDEGAWVGRLRQYASDPLGEPVTDATVVAVRHSLDKWFALEPDKVVVQQLDMGNVRVISHIIGQSVALDHYNKKVDQAIEIFTPILGEIAHSGRSDTVKSTRLLQLIGSNSLLYTYVVTKLGLLDPSQIAWQSDKHYDVWRALRQDYEIERRFEALKNKLGPMLENAKFILEVREDKKSERSEIIIIALIAMEIALHLLHNFLPQLLAVLDELQW